MEDTCDLSDKDRDRDRDRDRNGDGDGEDLQMKKRLKGGPCSTGYVINASARPVIIKVPPTNWLQRCWRSLVPSFLLLHQVLHLPLLTFSLWREFVGTSIVMLMMYKLSIGL